MGKKNQAAENIKVLVRCRPLSDKEKSGGFKSCVDLDMTSKSVIAKGLSGEDRFTFDAVINNTFSQKDIFVQYIQPLVDCMLDGFNATVFAYGQSGSGKTHTMTGVMGNPDLEGVIPRSVTHIFDSIESIKKSNSNKSFTLSVIFVELYNGKVRDLLAKQQVPLDVRETKDHVFYVQGAQQPNVSKPQDIFHLMEQGIERRRTGSTELNADSSRSHSVFTIILNCAEVTENGTLNMSSKLNLVDLAGSERQSKTGASGERLLEGCNINLSLSALGTVIDTIVKGQGHIPFRSSQLTMLLKDSLGGNSKTVMFANINPSEHNHSETVSTLRFADRAKQIKNKPVVNMDSKDQKIAELTQEIQDLRNKLSKLSNGGTDSLEKELEDLRAVEDELRVQLDNAEKGRQADSLDFENAKAKLAAETKELNAKIAEGEDLIAKMKNDLQLAESAMADGAMAAKEILQICTSYLRQDKPFEDAEDLRSFFKEAEAKGGLAAGGGGASAAEIAQLESTIESLKSTNKAFEKETNSKIKEMQDRAESDKKTIQSSEAKIKKLSEELKAVKDELKALEKSGDTAKPASSDQLVAAEEAMKALEKKNIVNTPQFKKIESSLDDIQRVHREVQNGVANELSSLKKHLGSRGADGEKADLVQELQRLVAESDKTISSLMSEVGKQNQLIASMRHVMKETSIVPFAVVKGGVKAAESSLDGLLGTEEQINASQEELIEKFGDNMTRTTEQRNRLLTAMCSGEENTDLRKELDQILSDNKKLQSEKVHDMKEIKKHANQAADLAMQEQVSEASGPGSPRAGGKEATALKKQVRDLKTELESLKNELSEERASNAVQNKFKESLYEDLRSQREELSKAEHKLIDLQMKMNEKIAEYEEKLGMARESGEVKDLKASLASRTEQVEKLRKLMESQKSLVARSNEKMDYFQEKQKETAQNMEKLKEHYEELLKQKDENAQKVINERLNEYAETCHQENNGRVQEMKKLRKKIKKLQTDYMELEEQFDKKLLEVEEYKEMLSDQKVKHMREVREMTYSPEQLEVMQQKKHIQSALDKAKMERQKKYDLFDQGCSPRRGSRSVVGSGSW